MLKPAWARVGTQASRWVTLAVLLAILAVFSYQQLRVGIFPVLEQPWNVAGQEVPEPFANVEVQEEAKAGAWGGAAPEGGYTEESLRALEEGEAVRSAAEIMLPSQASDVSVLARKAAPSKAVSCFTEW